MVRRRPVSFGNPALGMYHGFVYTLEGDISSSSAAMSNHHHHHRRRRRPVVEEATEVQCLVAVVDVPPEQIPEGILNLSLPHRSFIHHVRIVIAEHGDDNSDKVETVGKRDHYSNKARDSSNSSDETNHRTSDHAPVTPSTEAVAAAAAKVAFTVTPSPNASAMETAASIFAEEHQRAVAANDSSSAGTVHTSSNNNSSRLWVPHARQKERTYLVLIELCSEEAADEFVRDLHQQPYTSLDETAMCSVYHVAALQGVTAGVSLMSPFFAPNVVPTTSPSAASGEDYNCAVCLELMDLGSITQTPPQQTSTGTLQNESTTATILTTVCNHSFHLDCLLQWQDSPCPVCRFDHSGLNETLSQCHVCGTTEHNYVCLICGVVSCGEGSGGATNGGHDECGTSAVTAVMPSRSACVVSECRSEDTTDMSVSSVPLPQFPSQYHQRILSSSSHARAHYDGTLHAYALNTETQHVWDFAGQGYVHRLLQNKEDGKLVEVNDPSNTTSQERSLSPGLTEAQEGEVVHRKLEGFASQYYTLLKSQLEQQRLFYEGRLEEIRHDYSASRKQQVSTTDLIAALKQERHQLSQRLLSLQTKCRKVEGNVSFIKSLNESLEANRGPLCQQVEQAQRERMDARKMFDECLPPLQEKVTRLMLQLENTSFNALRSNVENDSQVTGHDASLDSH